MNSETSKINFASDNYSGVHPEVLTWIQEANHSPAPAYGHDAITLKAIQKLQEEFGETTKAFFVWNGTAANVLGLKAALRPYHAIVCSDVGHIHADECGAPEYQIGSKIVTVPSTHGKIALSSLSHIFDRLGEQ